MLCLHIEVENKEELLDGLSYYFQIIKDFPAEIVEESPSMIHLFIQSHSD